MAHTATPCACTIIDHGSLTAISAARASRLVRALPPGQQIYTAISENGRDLLIVGLRLVNRIGLYLGSDLLYPEGTCFEFTSYTNSYGNTLL